MRKKLYAPVVLIAALLLILTLAGCSVSRVSGLARTDQTAGPAATPAETAVASTPAAVPSAPAEAQAQKGADALMIPIAELDENAHFYPLDMDGVKVEVIALKLADGSIRAAFNACQVCFDSGMGYYVQEGRELVCQNCGNRFTMDQVGLSGGGCNPVPIGEADRASDGTTITISRDELKKGEVLFQNRKN